MRTPSLEALVFGQRLRQLRRARGLTLEALGRKVGKGAPYLSLIENGRREPRLILMDTLAEALGVTPAELLASEPPGRRAHLEIELRQAQDDPLYRELGLPWLKPSSRVPDGVLEHVLGLYEALKRRSEAPADSPEAARLANIELRARMRSRGNHFPEIEQAAARALEAVGYPGSGPVTERILSDLVAHFRFSLHRVQDMPISVESVTDLEHRRIYIHRRNELPTRAARSVLLQALGHVALGHAEPSDFAQSLRQRIEANYFAGAVLAPERPAAEILARARREGDICAQDLKEVFYISYEMAAHRLTNLITRHLSLPVHFLRCDEEGIISKAYENDGLPLPTDDAGVVEGQRACRHWAARQAFRSEDRFADYSQYTETPAGVFWSVTRVEVDRRPHQAITLGTRAEFARHFRGHGTGRRRESRCPDGECCARPRAGVASRWQGKVRPSARTHAPLVAVPSVGTFAGVDLSDVYEFLEHNEARRPGP